MATAQLLLTANGAWNVVARRRTRHRALTVRAATFAGDLGAWRTGLMALLVTLRVAATHLARRFAQLAVPLAMACLLAGVSARGVRSTIRLLARPVSFGCDHATCPLLALLAGSVADVPTWQEVAARGRTVIAFARNVGTALYSDLVATAWHRFDNFFDTANALWVQVLIARQGGLDVATTKLNLDPGHLEPAVFRADVAARAWT